MVSALCGISFSAVAQQKKDSIEAQHIKDVVVTGQYSPNDPAKSVQKIKIIGRQKIEMMNAQNLRDVLTNELNVRQESDNILGSFISVSGLSGRNVKILIDGVPVIGKLDGSIDVSQINLNNIERIEVVEGPMAVNYGTDALGGAINLITKKELKKTVEGGVTAYYETTGTYNLTGRVGFTKKKHTVTLNGGRNFFDGWNPGEQISFDYSPRLADYRRYHVSKPREQYFGSLQYIYRTGKNTTINYKGDYFNELITNRGIPDRLTRNSAIDDYYRTKRIDNAVFLNTKVRNGGINVLASYNDYQRVKNTYAKDLVTLNEILSSGEGAQDTSKYNQFNTRGTYTNDIGKKINYEAGYDINLQNGTGRRILNKTQFIGDYAVYASAEYKPFDGLIIRPGLRYAYNTTFNPPLIPSVSASYKVASHVTLRASYSKGFRAPDLKELYFDFVDVNHNIKGNPDLKAEYSDNYNASAVYANMFGKILFKADVSGYYNNIRDMIFLAWTGVGVEYRYVNIGKYLSHGIQANVDVTISNVKLSLGGSCIGRYNDLSEAYTTVKKFSYAPEVRGSIMYTWPAYGMNASVFFKYNGSMPGVIVNEKNELEHSENNAYTIADVNVNKTIIKNTLQIGVGCKNLFDVTNVANTRVNTTTGAHTSNSGMLMANGRLYLLKLDYNF
jgi:outer membrane receptor for ferrienterochelin and colicins